MVGQGQGGVADASREELDESGSQGAVKGGRADDEPQQDAEEAELVDLCRICLLGIAGAVKGSAQLGLEGAPRGLAGTGISGVRIHAFDVRGADVHDRERSGRTGQALVADARLRERGFRDVA